MAVGGRPVIDPASPASDYWRRATIAVAVVVIVALVIVGSRSVVARLNSDPTAIHDPASLPARIHVCGRDWSRGALDRRLTLGQARAMKVDGAPSVVAVGPFAPCPVGPCTAVAGGACDTVVFVRVGQDAYVAYELVGGP